MEIQKSLVIYSSQNKNQTFKTEALAETKKKNSHDVFETVENIANTQQHSTAAEFIPGTTDINLKQSLTKTVLSSAVDVEKNQSINLQTTKALEAYNTELNKFSKEKVANLISGIDFFV